MNYKVNLLAALIVASVVGIPTVFAASSPAEVYEQCKKEAEAGEVAPADMQNYLRGCMEENGIEAADVDGLLQDVVPNTEDGEQQKPADDMT